MKTKIQQLQLGFGNNLNDAPSRTSIRPATGMDRARLWFAHIQQAIDRAVGEPSPEPPPVQSWLQLACGRR